MRLIGSVKNQQDAVIFQKFCKSLKIDILVEKAGKDKTYQVWIVSEDDTDKAEELLERFNEDPSSPEFYLTPELPEDTEKQEETALERKTKLPIFTWLWIGLSVFIFMTQLSQEVAVVKKGGVIMMEASLTPIENAFFFDVPTGFEKITEFFVEKGIKNPQDIKNLSEDERNELEILKQTAYFHGYLDMLDDPLYKESYIKNNMSLFKKIREGEIYRLITPALLHGSILHILFNMIWIFILLKQIELKLGIFKTACLVTICGVIPNVAQYLISGPFFVGASGIIVGLAGFIWMRQKKAPWEGYVLSRAVFFFLLVYVLSLAALSIGIFVFNLSASKNLAFGIANTAHVVGGLTGLVLGRFSFFRRT